MPIHPKTVRPPWLPPKREAWTHPNRWEGYNTRRWKDARLALLVACQYVCATEGCTRPASTVDHVKPISSGHDPWDRANWQALCAVCHKDKTTKEAHDAQQGSRQRRGRGGVHT